MNDRKMMATGIVGFGLAALCCATPVLAILLTAVGLSAVLGYLDYVLIPAMVLFLAIILYAAYRRRQSA
jgi:mercuric ion transport protein